jgi:hypothetical protein
MEVLNRGRDKLNSLSRRLKFDITWEQFEMAINRMDKFQKILRITRFGYDQSRPKEWSLSKLDWTLYIAVIIISLRFPILFFTKDPQLSLILGDPFAFLPFRFQLSGFTVLSIGSIVCTYFTWQWMEVRNRMTAYEIIRTVLRNGFTPGPLSISQQHCKSLRRIIYICTQASFFLGPSPLYGIAIGGTYCIIESYHLHNSIALIISQCIWMAMLCIILIPAFCSLLTVVTFLNISAIYANYRLEYIIRYGEILLRRSGRIPYRSYLKFLKIEKDVFNWIYRNKQDGRVINFVGYYVDAFYAEFATYVSLFAKTGNHIVDYFISWVALLLYCAIFLLSDLGAAVPSKVGIVLAVIDRCLQYSNLSVLGRNLL